MSLSDPHVPDAADRVAQLTELLDVEEIDIDLYRGARQPGGKGRVFGGQVIAQALVAATRSVDPARVAHSLHAYFMRPGDEALPIIYRVTRDHDGGSFTTRRVIAMQRGRPILNMAASFQAVEAGYGHADAMPDVPDPDALGDERDYWLSRKDELPAILASYLTRERAIEFRPVKRRDYLDPRPEAPAQQVWFRASAPLGDDPALHRAVLAYASDMVLLGTSTLPHGFTWFTPGIQAASLDHALWLHEDFRADDWLLYATDSPWAGGGRGFNRGTLFTRDGRLVASVAQEGLIRNRVRGTS